MGLCLTMQLMSPQKIIVINNVHYFDFLVSCLHTFNPLSLSLKSVGNDLGCKCNNMQKHEEKGSPVKLSI